MSFVVEYLRQVYQKIFFESSKETIITASISASIGITLFLSILNKRRIDPNKFKLINNYISLCNDNQDEKDQDVLFVPSKLNKKYLKNAKIESIYSKSFITKQLGIKNDNDAINKFILDLCLNPEFNSNCLASFYSGSTAQKRGNSAYVGSMGDGRVVTSGTINKFDIQLKGFGQTTIAKQYFKHKDGKLSLSEYKSEIEIWNKIKKLNIPTYQILAAVLLNGKCKRKRKEQESMFGIIRSAKCWFRVGHFEYLYYSQKSNKTLMLWMIKYIVNNVFNDDNESELVHKYDHIFEKDDVDYSLHLPDWMKLILRIKKDEIELCSEDDYDENDMKLVKYFIYNVIKRNAFLISKMMLNGVVHGMLRSDNINLSGIIFDIGGCQILDENEINDKEKCEKFIKSQPGNVEMYSYQYQPECIAINMKNLVICLSVFVKDISEIQNELYKYWSLFWLFLELDPMQNDEQNALQQFLYKYKLDTSFK